MKMQGQEEKNSKTKVLLRVDFRSSRHFVFRSAV